MNLSKRQWFFAGLTSGIVILIFWLSREHWSGAHSANRNDILKIVRHYSNITNRTISFHTTNDGSFTVSGTITTSAAGGIETIAWVGEHTHLIPTTNQIYQKGKSIIWEKDRWKSKYSTMKSAINSARGVSQDAFYWVAGLIAGENTFGDSTNWTSGLAPDNPRAGILQREFQKITIAVEYDPGTFEILGVKEDTSLPLAGFSASTRYYEQ